MQFTSYRFVFVFLPVFLLVYYTLGRRWRQPVLILGGAVFYAFAGWKDAAILTVSILLTGGIAWGLDRLKAPSRRKALLALGLVLHAGSLFFYKYAWLVPRMTGDQTSVFAYIAQPLGFSFFSFQQMMYLLSLFRGEIEGFHPLDYLSWILYFPKLTMGPLAEPKEIMDQIRDPRSLSWNWNNVASGLQIFSFGMFKKLVLSDTFARAVNEYFQWVPRTSSLELALIMLSYTFQIYFDFSGYIDMAAGISSMLNISLPLNFNSPYKALSVSDFWRRWHMTLTRFFTRNIYIPLGGNRKGTLRTCLNIMIVFLVSGMWHGAHPNFLLWGGLNGLLLIAERGFRRKERKIPKMVSWPFTFLTVNLLWLLFRSGTVGQWLSLVRQMLAFTGGGLRSEFTDAFFVPEMLALLRLVGLEGLQQSAPWAAVTCFMGFGIALVLIPRNSHSLLLEKHRLSPGFAFLAGAALLLSVLCLGTESVFIYSGF